MNLLNAFALGFVAPLAISGVVVIIAALMALVWVFLDSLWAVLGSFFGR